MFSGKQYTSITTGQANKRSKGDRSILFDNENIYRSSVVYIFPKEK